MMSAEDYEEEQELMLRLHHLLGRMPQVDLPLLLEEYRHVIKAVRPHSVASGWVLETLADEFFYGGTIRSCVYRMVVESFKAQREAE